MSSPCSVTLYMLDWSHCGNCACDFLSTLPPAMIESAGQDPLPEKIEEPDFPIYTPLLNFLPQKEGPKGSRF
jgi:hypothetical protein